MTALSNSQLLQCLFNNSANTDRTPATGQILVQTFVDGDIKTEKMGWLAFLKGRVRGQMHE